jgi:hypothetical protein
LLKILVESGRSMATEKTIAAICRRVDDRDAAAAAVIGALPGTDDSQVRAARLRLLESAPCPRALEALRKGWKDPDAFVRDTAVRVLSNWPDFAAMADLLEVYRKSPQGGQGELALGGLARMAGLPGGAPERKVQILEEAGKLSRRPEERKKILAALSGIHHTAALDLAVSYLNEDDLEVEAAVAVVKIAKGLRNTNPREAEEAVQKILEVCKSPTARQVAESSMFVPRNMKNIASQGRASSPDGWEKDGAAGGDGAAIDGDPGTYWDEENGKNLYRLVVEFPQPKKIAAISILGYQHHQYSPRDFEVLCDGVVVKKVEKARYDANFLVIRLDPVNARTVEIKITGYYGSSPAIRELGIYRPTGGR